MTEILFVGTFIPRKHALQLGEAVLSLKAEVPELRVHFVGSHGGQERALRRLAEKHPETVVCQGRIHGKEELRRVYAQCGLFALPSTGETFGLVYIEALSQGLPVLYTHGDGVDGLIPDDAGVGLTATSREGITQGLRTMLAKDGCWKQPRREWFEKFRWGKIAKHYNEIYDGIWKR